MLDSHVVIYLHVCVYALARQFVTKTPSRPQSFAWRAITSCKCMHALLLLVKIHCHLLNTVVLQCLMLPSFIILLLRKLQVARLLTAEWIIFVTFRYCCRRQCCCYCSFYCAHFNFLIIIFVFGVPHTLAFTLFVLLCWGFHHSCSPLDLTDRLDLFYLLLLFVYYCYFL